ncbi:MAG: ABC transporter permease, partial [Ruminiclostridium sp.]
MKHSALKKNAFIEILKTKSRFLSIFGIVAIGVAFFAGVKGASPDMKISADTYFDSSRLMDYRLVSTLGFDDEDIKAIENADENLSVYPSYFVDVLLKSEKGNRALRVEAMIDGVNNLTLKEGRFPEKENECI